MVSINMGNGIYMTRVVILSALRCEVDCLIKYYNLKKKLNIHEFEVFSNKDESKYVVISGVGGVNAANLIGFLRGKEVLTNESVLINLGIAGSKNLKIGELVSVSKLSKANNKKVFYPSNIRTLKFEGAYHSLKTSDVTVVNYSLEMVDMEAYDIFISAIKYVSLENIIFLKVISDNEESHIDNINAELVDELVKENLESIIKVIENV
jgi:hypothetical protein